MMGSHVSLQVNLEANMVMQTGMSHIHAFTSVHEPHESVGAAKAYYLGGRHVIGKVCWGGLGFRTYDGIGIVLLNKMKRQ